MARSCWRQGCVAMGPWSGGSPAASARARPRCSIPSCSSRGCSASGSPQESSPADRPGRAADRAAHLPPARPRIQRPAGRPLPRAAVAHHFGVALLAGKRAGRRRPSSLIRAGFVLLAAGVALLIPLVPRVDSGWYLVVPLIALRCGPRPARLPAQQLHAVPDLGGTRRRSRRRQLGDQLVRPVVGVGVRGRDPARRAVDRLHEQIRRERGPARGGQGAGRRRPRGRRGGDERRAAGGAARRPTAGDPGRDPPDQR